MKQNVVQSLIERIAVLDKRIANLERLRANPNLGTRDLTDTQINQMGNAQSLVWDKRKQAFVPTDPTDVAFSYPGSVLSATSPPYTPKDTIFVSGMAVSVGTPGTTTSTITLKRNGVTIITASLLASKTYVFTALPANTAANYNGRLDAMTIGVTPGTGLADLVVTVELG